MVIKRIFFKVSLFISLSVYLNLDKLNLNLPDSCLATGMPSKVAAVFHGAASEKRHRHRQRSTRGARERLD